MISILLRHLRHLGLTSHSHSLLPSFLSSLLSSSPHYSSRIPIPLLLTYPNPFSYPLYTRVPLNSFPFPTPSSLHLSLSNALYRRQVSVSCILIYSQPEEHSYRWRNLSEWLESEGVLNPFTNLATTLPSICHLLH